MKALVLSAVTLNGAPAKVGDSVEVDAQTFANLSRKGKLGEASAKPRDPIDEPQIENREQTVTLNKRKK
jgi:hypothetical protein